MSNTMYTGRIFDALVVANGTPATSAAIRMDNAITMSVHTQVATTAGTINVTYTYELSSNNDASAIWTAGTVTIGNNGPGLEVLSFAPEASKFIRIIATNVDASDVTLTAVLNMQEAA